MTKTYDLTENELRAAMVLVTQDCLAGMGGDRPSDLDNDPYTWVAPETLIKNGWSKFEAAGTFGALIEKGMIDQMDKNEWALSTSGYQFLDTLWDVYQQGLKSTVEKVAKAKASEKEQNMTTTAATFATIDINNLKVEFFATATEAVAHADKNDFLAVSQDDELAALSGSQMVALYNTTAKELDTGLTEVTRFATKDAGTKRLWANLVDLAEMRARLDRLAKSSPKAVKSIKVGAAVAKKVADKARDGAAPANREDYPAPAKPAVRRGTGINLAPMKKAYACRAGSKQAILVDMLSREQGATMVELLEALSGGTKPWKEVSVKSGMNWDMNKVKGYGIRTSKRGEEDCYHLVLPTGLKAPIAHLTKTEKGE